VQRSLDADPFAEVVTQTRNDSAAPVPGSRAKQPRHRSDGLGGPRTPGRRPSVLLRRAAAWRWNGIPVPLLATVNRTIQKNKACNQSTVVYTDPKTVVRKRKVLFALPVDAAGYAPQSTQYRQGNIARGTRPGLG
jgi:hypothetical protein